MMKPMFEQHIENLNDQIECVGHSLTAKKYQYLFE